MPGDLAVVSAIFDRFGADFDCFGVVFDRFGAVFNRLGAVFDRPSAVFDRKRRRNDRKWRRNEAFEFNSNCQAPQRATAKTDYLLKRTAVTCVPAAKAGLA